MGQKGQQKVLKGKPEEVGVLTGLLRKRRQREEGWRGRWKSRSQKRAGDGS